MFNFDFTNLIIYCISMKPSTELFRLIKSLSKSEKRYFKLTSSLQTGEKNYIKLFDAIEMQSEYDEVLIKEKFKDEVFINHLPSEKNHLYSLILKSLRGFYSDKSAASILQEQLRNIELLYNKALYKECAKTIKKAKKIAYDYEKYYFLLDLINWEKTISEEIYSKGHNSLFTNDLINEETDCLEKLKNIAEYQKLYSRISYAIRRGGYRRNKAEAGMIKEIATHPLITGKNTAITTKATVSCYMIKGLCAATEKESEESYTNFKKVIAIMENNPLIMKEIPKRYIKAINSLLYNHMDNQNWDEVFSQIKKMKSLSTKSGFESIDIQLLLFGLPHNAELNIHIRRGDFDKAIEIVPSILKGIEDYKGKLSGEKIMLFYYNMSRAYFGAGDYKNALKYINLVLNNFEIGLREDVYTFSRLIDLVIHYELGNFDLLDYSIKSTKRTIVKNRKNYDFELAFLQDLQKMIKVKNVQNLLSLLVSFKANLKQILEDPYEKVALEYFDFISWLDSKIENKRFDQVIKEKFKINVV